jgi:hypothetical protein
LTIPAVDRASLERALVEFDATLPGRPDWLHWERNGAQLYAIDHDGRWYPPKKIIALATGEPVSEFSAGRASNDFLTQRGFQIIRLPTWTGTERSTPTVPFKVGRVYDRWSEINEPFGGGRQSGISAGHASKQLNRRWRLVGGLAHSVGAVPVGAGRFIPAIGGWRRACFGG